ncbi:MAG: right-handed parallel beta-helix repeat-containing protein [Kiritimatiellaeota bacterium]|nr:right-handed parallel beta-helix repeat-containing protein [Kiritimatiellota bacterium]
MKTLLHCTRSLMGCFAFAAIGSAAATLYVSPAGNDSWSGRLRVPDAAGADGPLASLDGARRAVRKLRSSQPGSKKEAIRVLFLDGTYRLRSPVAFTPEDSGTKEQPVVYAAAPNAHPVFSGGRRLRGFRIEQGVWKLTLPEVKAGKWVFRSLFVNGRRAVRARSPNAGEGYYHIRAPAPPVTDPKTGKEISREKTAFVYSKDDLKPWPDLGDVLVVNFDAWDTSILPIAALDPERRVVSFAKPTFWAFKRLGNRYYVENAPDALDAPGEWRLDRRTGQLSYIPRPGETPDTARVIAPEIEQFVRLQGDAKSGLYVENIRFEGLTFEYGDWRLEDGGYRGMQAAWQVPAVVEATSARRIVLANCVIRNVGLYAVAWGAGCRENRVTRCHFHHLGAGGVKIGTPGNAPSPALETAGNTVENCFIHHGGAVYPAAVGVWIGRSSYNIVSHNEISDLYYTAISVGWDWGYAPSSAHDNRIEYNHLHRLGRGYLSDMGGIYTLGISPGTVLRGNVIHDMDKFKYGATGIYLDQSSSQILVEDNLCYRCQTGGFTLHYGKDNIVRNNIFALGRDHQISLGRPEKHRQLTFTRNIVYYREGPLTGYKWGEGEFESDHNLYWDASGAPVKFGKYTFDEWRKLGRDKESRIADPRFKAPENADFALAPDSPALALGFKPFDPGKAGLYGDPAWVALPTTVAPLPLEPRPRPQPFADDFEDTAAGRVPIDGQVYGAEAGAHIRVTDRTAATGKHSLEIKDSPEVKEDYNPHLVYSPNFENGRLILAFDLRLEAGATPTIECRDWSTTPYRVGPSLAIGPDGTLKTADRSLVRLPANAWVRIEISCELGKKADGAWDLTVVLPDGKRRQWRRLPCVARKFSRVTWVGFVSDGRRATSFWLDNIRIALAGATP